MVLLTPTTALSLLAILAGCSENRVSPLLSLDDSASPSPSPGSSAGPTSSPSPASSSTPVATTWTFSGTTANLVAVSGQTPSAVTLPSYMNIAGSFQFGAVSSGSGTINVSDALNNGDVVPNTLPADDATAGATPVHYVSFYNGTSADISFGSNTPQITITNTAGFGSATTCELDVYSNNGGPAIVWHSIGATGTISGNSVTINATTLTAGQTEDFQPGQKVTAIACK